MNYEANFNACVDVVNSPLTINFVDPTKLTKEEIQAIDDYNSRVASVKKDQGGQRLIGTPQAKIKQGPLAISPKLHAYISELIQKDVKKATHIICALEEGNETRLKEALEMRRHSFFQPEKTTGTDIYRRVEKRPRCKST